ncbi:hypothetical protein DP116_02710 [Brasilonema bromeliae SPC951]|uniref:Uncharacterized protein n=1 Tax=Brasilonema bromeliae SPC951 TaxID=385972 RepID=A0ABX1P2A3_9CYAN|nr:hypothetical protein [Brasilonema bromeliae SPC951]
MLTAVASALNASLYFTTSVEQLPEIDEINNHDGIVYFDLTFVTAEESSDFIFFASTHYLRVLTS